MYTYVVALLANPFMDIGQYNLTYPPSCSQKQSCEYGSLIKNLKTYKKTFLKKNMPHREKEYNHKSAMILSLISH